MTINSSYQLDSSTKQIFGLGCFLGIIIIGIPSISMIYEYNKTSTLTRVKSAVFLLLFTVSQIFFVLTIFVISTNVFISSIIIILMLLVIYGISKANY
jgi:hypothetical protein